MQPYVIRTAEGLPAVVFPAERGEQEFMVTFHPDDRDGLESAFGPMIPRVYADA